MNENVLLDSHLKTLKLPTFLREYGQTARQCADGRMGNTGGPSQGFKRRESFDISRVGSIVVAAIASVQVLGADEGMLL